MSKKIVRLSDASGKQIKVGRRVKQTLTPLTGTITDLRWTEDDELEIEIAWDNGGREMIYKDQANSIEVI